MPSAKPHCTCALQRKTGTKSPSQPGSPFSAVRFACEESRKMGIFRVFQGKDGEISLQLRLRGGAGGIRTIGTGLKPARSDVSVSYTESGASRILRNCLLAAESPLTARVFKGVRGRILGDCVGEGGHFKAPQSAWLGCRETARLAGSHEIETFSREKVYLKRGISNSFRLRARTFSAVIATFPQNRLLSWND